MDAKSEKVVTTYIRPYAGEDPLVARRVVSIKPAAKCMIFMVVSLLDNYSV
jgi:hypothetical protein